MRWTPKGGANDGDTRVRRIFLWFPSWGCFRHDEKRHWETRWLEWVTVRETFSSLTGWSFLYWDDAEPSPAGQGGDARGGREGQ